MSKVILIATSMKPLSMDSFHHCCDIFESVAREKEVNIKGISWTTGPGCSNLALDCNGPDEAIDKLADRVTISLMPAKWGVTTDIVQPGRCCLLTFNS